MVTHESVRVVSVGVEGLWGEGLGREEHEGEGLGGEKHGMEGLGALRDFGLGVRDLWVRNWTWE